MAFLFYRLRYSDVYFFSFFSLHFFFLSLSYLLVKKKQQRTKAAHNEHYIDICLILKKKRRIKRKKKKRVIMGASGTQRTHTHTRTPARPKKSRAIKKIPRVQKSPARLLTSSKKKNVRQMSKRGIP